MAAVFKAIIANRNFIFKDTRIMRYKAVFSMLFSLFLGTANANWVKINEVDYTWGPFNIYHISLFTETGVYSEGSRPLMLSLQYKKPWAGRDFAISLARTWDNLGIKLPEDELDAVVNRLRKNFPDIKTEDKLHYIALEDRGYFILNDKVVSESFNKAFNDAIVAVWLDPKMDISRQLLDPNYSGPPKQAEVKPETTKEVEAKHVEVKQENAEPVSSETTEPQKAVTLETQADNVATETVKAETPTLQPATEAKPEEPKPEPKKEEKVEKVEEKTKQVELENPEIFISPIYDDLLMLAKAYI